MQRILHVKILYLTYTVNYGISLQIFQEKPNFTEVGIDEIHFLPKLDYFL